MVITAGKKKYKQAAKKLILSVKSSEDSERERLIKFQTEKLSIKEKPAQKNAKKIINERKFIVRNLVSGLIDKNVEAISLINQDISRLTQRYHELETEQPEPIQAPVVEEVPAKTELAEDNTKDLKKEIKNLKQEVHITLTTLNNIFKEFSSMFGEDDIPDGQMSVDQIITAMASFAKGSNSKEKGPSDNSSTPEPAVKESAQVKEDIQDGGDAGLESKPVTPSEVESSSELENKEQMEQEPEAKIDSETTAEPELQVESEQSDSNSVTEQPENKDSLDFSVDAAIDDIDSALDELELDSVEEEPDWGDAFEESGDTMESDPDKKQ